MKKIFILDKSQFVSTEDLAIRILKKYFSYKQPIISRTENKKPYLENPKQALFFSVSHTKERVFFAVSDKNVGIDAEHVNREVEYVPILKNFPDDEQRQISSTQDFLRFWTIKESVIKWIGGKLARDLKNIAYVDGQIYYKNLPLPVCITTKTVDSHVVSLCNEQSFDDAEWIFLDTL